MPANIPVPDKTAGDVFTESMWDLYIRDNVNKLLDRGHRVLTVAQFSALVSLEDGDEVYLEVDASAGVIWHLRYVSSEPTYKWRFLGGPPLVSEVDTPEATSSATYTALTTAGPSVALPRAGDYMVDHGSLCDNETSATQQWHSYDVGASAAVDADAVSTQGDMIASASRRRRKTGLTSVTLTSKYRSGGAASKTFSGRFMAVTPLRLRHDA